MASAEMQNPQSKEDKVNRSDPDFSSNNMANQSSKRPQRTTRQLDFFQAMSDFKHMFPTMDDDVIEAVLRANDGAVDATIDQLLTMSIDSDEPPVLDDVTHTAMIQAFCPEYKERDSASPTDDSPPSYSEAIRSQPEQSIWTTPIPSPQISSTMTVPSRNILDLDVDELALSNTEPKVFSPLPSSGSQSRHQRSGLDEIQTEFSYRLPAVSDSGVPWGGYRQNGAHVNRDSQNTPRKTAYRNWNPPMLGNLPDDFLRLMPPEVSPWQPDGLTSTPMMPVADLKPKVHKVRSKSEKQSKSVSRESKSHSSGSDKKSKSDKLARSFSVADTPPAISSKSPVSSSGSKVSRSQSARSREKNGVRSRDTPSMRSPTSHGMVFQTHDFSTNMLHERMKENERRRKRTSIDVDPELTQYLEDERLAIMLQNSEFLQELRGNEDFMKTLEHDRQSSSTIVPKTLPGSDVSPSVPEDRAGMSEGYGQDNQETLGAFPFSQSLPRDKDDDAELRSQLKQMGKASRKQFAALARKFFKRRKKNTSKYILREKLAPSMVNLLDDEEEENGETDDRHDQFNSSPSEIEPLSTSLLGIPNHRTVQRPSYHPDTVTTYFDNKNVDMV